MRQLHPDERWALETIAGPVFLLDGASPDGSRFDATIFTLAERGCASVRVAECFVEHKHAPGTACYAVGITELGRLALRIANMVSA